MRIILILAFLCSINQAVFSAEFKQVAVTNKSESTIWGFSFSEIKAKVVEYQKLLNNPALSQNMKIALILMAIGLVFFILGQGLKIDRGVFWAVGAIFFLVGAFLLLFEILGLKI